jgi:hypothetical protein
MNCSLIFDSTDGRFTCVIWDYFLSQRTSGLESVLEYQTQCIPQGIQHFAHFVSIFTILEPYTNPFYFFKKWKEMISTL